MPTVYREDMTRSEVMMVERADNSARFITCKECGRDYLYTHMAEGPGYRYCSKACVHKRNLRKKRERSRARYRHDQEYQERCRQQALKYYYQRKKSCTK